MPGRSSRHYTLFVAPPGVVQQDRWQPRWRVDLDSPGGVRRLSTVDDDTGAPFYEGRLLETPVITRRMRDSAWGVVDVEDVSFSIANWDLFLPADSPETLRGRYMTVKRFDARTRYASVEYSGIVSDGALSPAVLAVRGTNVDAAVLEREIPTRAVDTATWPKAVDVGVTVPVVVGSCPKMRLPYVREDVIANQYDYLVGHGTLTVSAAFRNGPNATHYPIGFAECLNASGVAATSWANASRTDLYAGFTVLRFPVAQLDFQNARHEIRADVVGLQPEKNFARFVRTLLTDTAWGLGKTVDGASFDVAENALDSVGGLVCEGALLRPTKAMHVLEQLLMVRGMRLSTRAGTTDWAITVDTPRTTTSLTLADGTADGPRNLLQCEPRTAPGISDAIARVNLAYRENLVDGVLIFSATRTLQSLGRVLDLTNTFIRDVTTADKVADFIGKRLFAGQTRVAVRLPQVARSLREGQLVSLTFVPLGFAAQTLEVIAVSKALDEVRADLAGYDVASFTYVAGTLPADPAAGTFTDYSRTAPAAATSLALSLTGTEAAADGTITSFAIISFTTPALNYGQAIVQYRKNATTTWAPVGPTASAGAGVLVKVPGLVTNQAYDFTVSVLSPFGLPSTGDPVLSNQTMPKDTTAPAAPTGLTATVGTGAAVALDWDDNAEADLGEYSVHRQTTDAWTDTIGAWAANKLAEVRASRFVDTTVTLGTLYYYRVRAIDRTENVAGSSASASATPTGAAQGTTPGTPSTPTLNTSGSYLGSDGTPFAFALLNVPALPSEAAGMNILLRTSGQTVWQIIDQRFTAGSGTSRCDDLTPGVAYEFALQAFNAFGLAGAISTALAHTAVGDTTAPAIPTSLAVASQHLKEAKFSLTAPADRDVKEYEWQLRTASSVQDATGAGSLVKSGSHDGLVISVNAGASVSYATAYHFRVRAKDFSGNPTTADGTGAKWTATVSVTFAEAATPDLGSGIVTTPNIATSAVSNGDFLTDDVGQSVSTTEISLGSVTVSTSGGFVQITARIGGDTAGSKFTIRIRKGSGVNGTVLDVLGILPGDPTGTLLGIDQSPGSSQTYTLTAIATTNQTVGFRLTAIALKR